MGTDDKHTLAILGIGVGCFATVILGVLALCWGFAAIIKWALT